MSEIDPEKIKKDIQDASELKKRVIISLTWMIETLKYQHDACKGNEENGLGGDYSPELTEAIAVLAILKGDS